MRRVKDFAATNPAVFGGVFFLSITCLYILAGLFLTSFRPGMLCVVETEIEYVGYTRYILTESLLRLALAVPAIIFLGWIFKTNGFRYAFSTKGFSAGLFAGSAFLLFSLWYLGEFYFGAESSNFMIGSDSAPSLIIPITVLLCVTMSLFEESVFRGLLMGGILRSWSASPNGRVSMVLISGLVFGAAYYFIINHIHIITFETSALLTLAWGVGVSAVYLYSKNLLVCIFLHTVHSLIVSFSSLVTGPMSAGGTLWRGWNVSGFIVLFAVIPVFAIILSINAKPFNEIKEINC